MLTDRRQALPVSVLPDAGQHRPRPLPRGVIDIEIDSVGDGLEQFQAVLAHRQELFFEQRQHLLVVVGQ